MDIEKIIYINDKNENIEFSANSIYHANINKIVEFSSVKNTLYTTAAMGQDGDTVTGNKIQSKTFTISGAIKSTNKDVIMQARRQLNKILNPHLTGKLVYQYKNEYRWISCRLETAPAFAKSNILVTFDIDVFCPYPVWQDQTEKKTNIAGWLGMFEFPLNTGGLEIPQNIGIEMGTKMLNTVVAISNDGDITTGMRVEFTAMGTVDNPKLTNVTTAEYMAFIGLQMQEGDKLTVTTDYKNKNCILSRGEEEINALAYWDTGGRFLQLETGENYFTFSAESNAERLEVAIFTANKYLGV